MSYDEAFDFENMCDFEQSFDQQEINQPNNCFQENQFDFDQSNIEFDHNIIVSNVEEILQKQSTWHIQNDSDSEESQEDEQTNAQRSRSRNREESKRKIKPWSKEENEELQNLHQYYTGNWEQIIKFMPGRTISQCKQHWSKYLNKEKKKCKWTLEEDKIIKDNINEAENNWASIALKLPNRTGKQVRERYINHLRTNISKKEWSTDEDQQLIQLYLQYPGKWALIARNLPGRSEIMIKNRYHKISKEQFPIKQEQQPLKLEVNVDIDEYFDLKNDTCEKVSENKKSQFKFEFSQLNSQTNYSPH